MGIVVKIIQIKLRRS